VAAAVVLLTACARGGSVFVLVRPPEVADAQAPHGRRLLPRTDLSAWVEVGRFRSAESCEEARVARFQAAATAARAAVGDAEAAKDLEVRRTVNARCVPAADVAAPSAGFESGRRLDRVP
jgi:hypothetical protein